jgi:Ras-related protein Rab-1A
MENNEPKTSVDVNYKELQEEINSLEIEVIPPPKIDNIKADLTFKLIVIGDPNVGKSCLSLKGTTGKFEDSYVATVGFDFYSFFAKIENKLIRLQIWDTCGQEGYRSLVQNFFRGTALGILVYAINDIKSFNNVGVWVKQLRAYSNPDIKMILVGNKNDLVEERKITEEEGKKCSKELDFFSFYETSAKTGFNSKEVFIQAVKLLYINYKKYNSGQASSQAAKLTGNKKLGKDHFSKERKKKKDCC